MHEDFWIMRPFNGVFWCVTLAFLALLVFATVLLRNRSEETRRRVLIIASIVTTIGFFVYKGFLSVDKEFDQVAAEIGGFNWWGELPLQLCNINMILIPIAVHWNKRALMSFCFFVGVLGAAMAVAMPGLGFSGYSLLLPRMIGFYGTHFAIVVEGLALATFGLYKPKFKDLPMSALALFVIALAACGISLLLRWTGLNPNANYFFSVETEGNAILELFHKFLPAPFLYLIPCLLILAAYMLVVMLVITGIEKLKAVVTGKGKA